MVGRTPAGGLTDAVAERIESGAAAVKLKVGPGDAASSLEQVRSRWPSAVVAADANGSLDEAAARAVGWDDLGVAYIEGGWPGALPKDDEFFRLAQSRLNLRNAELVAFGSTRRPGTTADKDPQLRALLDGLARSTMPYACPNGHPTMVHITYSELDKRFQG